ncbi:MAG: RNA polymerase sporulation sigma factor SigK [Clostridiaceae bacterium]|nr:RNA polymerase sporulation sigma factor SigK [Clostridiaceae bacterium]
MFKRYKMIILHHELIAKILSQYVLAGFITGPQSFPQPLSPQDEQKYVELCKEGDENARNILIEHNLRLVAHVARKYSSSNTDSDDLISIGTIGLIKAVSSYDPSKGIRLATYAARCIENEILMHLRASKKLQNEVSLNEPLGTDKEGNEIALIDILGCEDEEVEEKVDLKQSIKKLYNLIRSALESREETIIRLRYGLNGRNGKTQREVAEKLGISRSYVSRIEKKALTKLYDGLK